MPKKGEYVFLKKQKLWEKDKFTVYNSSRFWKYFSGWRQWKAKSRAVIYKHGYGHGNGYGYKLVCVDDKCSEPFKKYLRKDVFYNIVNSIIEESKYLSNAMKKHFNKELVMTKGDNENFKIPSKCWICDNDYVDNDINVRYHCHITGVFT